MLVSSVSCRLVHVSLLGNIELNLVIYLIRSGLMTETIQYPISYKISKYPSPFYFFLLHLFASEQRCDGEYWSRREHIMNL